MKDLLQQLRSAQVHTLLAQFTDIHGVAKGKYLPIEQLDQLLTEGAGFSGPSIAGTGLPRTGPRSEYWGRGIASTAQVLPWMPGYARIVCDGYVAGEPFDACPRQVLRRAEAQLAKQGWYLRTGIEPEFFLLRRDAQAGYLPFDARDGLDKPSYDLKTLPRQAGLLRELHKALASSGLEVLQIDHEDAQGQYELNFGHDLALRSADHLMLFKLAAQAIAEQHGAVFSMMPKPFANQPGSGMHFHVSMWRGEGEEAQCMFEDHPGQPAPGGAALMQHFIAGVLAHAGALCALAAPTVNSYKRLVVGESLSGTSWAPAYVAHGPNNRTALVRTLKGRFEWRLPDASANPYLATAGLIAAGLDGIQRRLAPPPACQDDLFELSLPALRQRGIALLPQSLDQALDALEADAVIGAALGEELRAQFLRLKRAEALAHARHVSDWELRQYAERY
ncbi:type III glutamate--ammonia ligase [Paucibacter sediminis]|uniref:Type III glutamate--ammonia ligase n=1 Tax=Paucibacter sediminis TaxID=3019553 RepID=A0AA95N9T9_9BURK|nr:type III glutamate--ammonia ligase [Paucibacter sp. S2-9]WIT11295.1 type III glutamate--ammonia ligase [Paucibacter sp. S2-9]